MKKKLWIIVLALAVLISVVLVWIFSFKEPESDSIETTDVEMDASYNLDVTMDEAGAFRIAASIRVKNTSDEKWSELGFYLVPNAMNPDETDGYQGEAATVDISAVTAEGEATTYQLSNNALMIELEEALEPGDSREVAVVYTLGLPENGMRLSQVDDNYYLAHWYPMLASFEDGWQIHDYDPKGESYATGYGEYIVSYELSKDYLVATSAQDGTIRASSSGTVQGDMIKDFYMAVMDPEDWEMKSRKVNDTTFRVFAPSGSDILADTTDLAADAHSYFEEMIGENPSKELDIIANDGYMEYPNIIEVATDEANLAYILVHEIAHQWFYLMVGNDPFNEAWLDESLTEFAMALFLSEYAGDDDIGFQGAAAYADSYTTATHANIPLDEFEESVYYATIYGEVPMLLKAFFDDNGGTEAAFEFLAAYYVEFQYQQVDTDDFKAFFEDYFKGDQQEFLDSWLQ
ncbi:M1 family metallopeptidase [Planococcus sp. ISL-109]|uniref:M1 family metallopeptidase n=1 Tax=Planococcus sp. ISL-109 TaxID=2819166 RepID=UPI001BEC2F71|nr:M1 family metallopeptidase [Planococcus sp. ISL-109]MBT2582248.1 peptidase [Planococcus sp. ISL-109]